MRGIIFIANLALLTACGSTKGSGNISTKVPAAVPTKTASISWTASTGGAPTGYVVEMSTDNITFTTATTVTGVSATVSGLVHGRTYYLRVKGVNGGGNSLASNVITLHP
jgi:hypothetical protein